jgi:hypothetical protein
MASQRIDVHTHGMREDAVAEVAAKGFKPTGGYKISVQWTPEAALAYMDRQGIAAQVVSMPMAFAGSDDDPHSRSPPVTTFCSAPTGPPPLRPP